MRHDWPAAGAAVEFTLTAALAAFFVASAAYKIAYPDKIPTVLAQLPGLRSLSERASLIVAGVVLGLEGFVAAALAFRFNVTAALWTVILLTMLFALVVAPSFEQLGGDCGCSWRWPPMSPRSGLELIARNTVIALVAAWLLQRQRRRRSLSR